MYLPAVSLLFTYSPAGAAPIQAGAQSSPATPPAAAPLPPASLPPAVPDSAKLSLRDAVKVGLRDNPQNTAAQYSVISAKENYNSQRAPINPTVQYGALNNTVAPADIATGFSQPYNYSAYVTLETNGAQKYRSRVAREQFHQAEFDASTTRLSLKLSIINAYVALQVANRTLEVEQTVYANVHQVADLTQKRFDIGSGTQADAIRAKIADVQEMQNVFTDAAAVESARATLNAQLGHPASEPIDAREALAYTPVPLPDLSQLTARAEKNRSEIQSAQANLKSLQAVPGLTASQYYPNVIVGRDFSSDGDVEIGMSVPIDLGNIRGAVNKARADVKTQQAEVELQRQQVDLDVKSSYVSLVAAQKQVDSYESGILKQSATLLDQMRQSYLLGANSILDLITAENTYRSVQSAYFSAVGAYQQALYTLEHAIGARLDAEPGVTLRAAAGAPVTEGGKKQ